MLDVRRLRGGKCKAYIKQYLLEVMCLLEGHGAELRQ